MFSVDFFVVLIYLGLALTLCGGLVLIILLIIDYINKKIW